MGKVAIVFVLICGLATTVLGAEAEESLWGKEPIENQTGARAEICLNGIWRFMPAAGPAAEQPTADWGHIRVPGDWRNTPARPGIVKKGTGPAWADFNSDELPTAWYERKFIVPKEWDGRGIMLDFQRISTDAIVFVNGKRCGTLTWPGNQGSVDITSAVKPGEEARLRLLVAATDDENEAVAFLATTDPAALEKKSHLESRGIIGDVTVCSRPKAAHVRDVFVQTSTRENLVLVESELSGIKEPGVVHIVARMLDENGREEKRFERDMVVEATDRQIVAVAWKWHNPRLWDFAKPNLYTCKLQVTGPGIDDEFVQPFGFREFWIDGRKFFLNGVEFRLRPTLGQEEWSNVAGTPEILEGQIDGLMRAGYNIEEHWPISLGARGVPNFRYIRADIADRKGWPLMGAAIPVTPYIVSPTYKLQWEENDNKKKWEAAMLADLRRMRNHPSICMWSTSANLFGFGQDQDPVMLGKKDWTNPNPFAASAWKYGQEAADILKKHDPTRPVFNHHGGYVGDLQTVNMYLCMLPLQEREEWPSFWADYGQTPFIAIEFGTPLHCSFMRGRVDFPQNIQTEPLMTEFCATYLGKKAYESEPKTYRDEIRKKFVDAQKYTNWQGNAALETAPAFQQFQHLFSTNTFRSWRTLGVTGGMVPWNLGHGWTRSPDADKPVPLPPDQPGQRGTRVDFARNAEINYLKEGPWKTLPAGQAIIASNGPTLAWIAGPNDAVAAKDHSFSTGQTIRKQIAIINDTRQTLDYSYAWQVLIAGKPTSAPRTAQGKIDPAKSLLFPLEFTAPMTLDLANAHAEIHLTAKIGDRSHEDRFPFRVFNSPTPTQDELFIFDPVGQTTRMLQQQRYKTREWKGERDARLLIVGREVLSQNKKPKADLEQFVRDGGRLLVFTQQPDWMRKSLGLRIAEHLPRRAFPVCDSHPALAGLDSTDLRDWNGDSTLLEARPDYFNGGKLGAHEIPYYGWHWGNRGAISSAAIEKPHRSGWRPIIECEFDLAYSPLMELDYGQGRAIWCTLDLEDHADEDPAAARLLTQIITYAQSAPLRPRAQGVILIGDDTDAANADAIGLNYLRLEKIEPSAKLTIVGSNAAIDPADLEACLNAGGKILFMPRKSPELALGVKLAQVKDFPGSLQVPAWPESAGLSPSDLRFRANADTWLIQSGGDIGAAGLLCRLTLGRGVAIFCQLDPDALDADNRTYFRYTRWRQTRAITQILANMGAAFDMDHRFFRPVPPETVESIPLDDLWRAKTVVTFPAIDGDKFLADPGISDQAKELLATELDHSTWPQIRMPATYAPFTDREGEAVFRKSVNLPDALVNKELVLSLGAIDDYDDVFINGQRIGGIDRNNPDPFKTPRIYTVPPGLMKAGKNIIAVRVWDRAGAGGFAGPAADMFLRPKDYHPATGFYHTDYRDDFELGDDPYRYFRW